MKLNERVAIITEENRNRLAHLYGEMDTGDLSRIVNNHLKAAIDEIEEDCLKQKEHCCNECDHVRMYDYNNKIYYCDHVNRTDDMGKLGAGDISRGCPEWCPLKNNDKNLLH